MHRVKIILRVEILEKECKNAFKFCKNETKIDRLENKTN